MEGRKTMMNLASYQVRKDCWSKEIVNVLSPTLQQAGRKVLETDPSLENVEAQILGGGGWMRVSRSLDNGLSAC